ncbi:MAG TPA: cation-transporting P-type ATPase [Burkholderiaceae bacterium]
MAEREAPAERLPGGLAHDQGLTAAQADAARQAFGANDIVAEPALRWMEVVRDTLRDPMLWFLLVTATLFALLGQVREAWVLLLALVPLLGMDAWLHHRTLASAAGLASRLASAASTLRDGRWAVIPARELVPGDLVEVMPGMYFPADGLLVSGQDLQVDESTLTGESLPVRKAVLQAPWAAGRQPESHWGVAGTRLLTGTARLRVIFTGGETRYGEIARSATEGAHAATPLQRAIGRLVAVLLAASVALCLALAAARLWQGHGWIDAVLSAVTLAVAALPEEFPVVYTFFLGLGVFRLARRKALVRRAVAVENIGRISCIVSDKTGTMTSGTLVLAHCRPAAGHDDAALKRTARLAARTDSGDPLDEALHATGCPEAGWQRLAEFPFTEARRRETVLWRTGDGQAVACTKGAPETMLGLCTLGDEERADWQRQLSELAGSGHKVIGCADRLLPPSEAATEPDRGFRFAGLLAFEDPVRPGVREAVAACRAAGMRVLMVTGDHPSTAAAIGREAGLGGDTPQVAVLGDDGSASALDVALHADIVARATPRQKLELVQALQRAGELVAVTADGVNDVPALQQADIGIAMGERGTRSAREVAPIVLMDDNFSTLVAAVAEGRQLFLNLRLAFAYLMLVHLPLVVGAAVIPLSGMPLLYLPLHIVWLELVIHPSAMLAFQDLPAQGPLAPVERQRRARFFSRSDWLRLLAVGGLACGFVVWGYVHALGIDQDARHARAMAMAALLLCSAAYVAALTGLGRPTAWWVVIGTIVPLVVLVQVPVLSAWLDLRPLHARDWALAAGGGLAAYAASRWLARGLRPASAP